ncbi:uncharacterized protein C3orf67 homolog isoform X2 [Triplophysa dalaica]|uniref:uncharacterized protein C3orf67 homolog isoform X2 n=1 Tax=Triplophysa dalaica TaxID=1582913 RepID=UPI0024DF33E9|nr:uncharacterized protein C3orf67 homolog isoform X2 [Triplophysa dalaica]
MFRNDYQGGPIVDIFSAQGKDPVAKWKLFGRKPSITKLFDKEVKGFVYSLDGSSQTHKMQLPKDGKMALGLIQRFLILQVNVPLGKDFSTEFLVTDEEHLKRRLYLSTVHRELSTTPLHARIPLTCLRHNIWCNLCIDLDSLSAEIFRGTRFLSLDGIVISACCKLRRIFTMKNEPEDSMDREIPRSCQFPGEVQHIIQLVNMKTLGHIDLKPAYIDSEETGAVKATITRGPTPRDSSHIAFGSKVIGPPPLTARKSNTPANKKADGSKSELSLNISADKCTNENIQPRPPQEKLSAERTSSSRAQRIPNVGREKFKKDKEDGKISLNQEGLELQGKLTGSTLQTLRLDSTAEAKLTDPDLRDSVSTTDTTGSVLQFPCASPLPACALSTDDADLCDTETELSLTDEEYEEEVFTFSSCPHSARRNQASSNPVEDLIFGLKGHQPVSGGERKDARLEDDFVGSESEEDEMHIEFLIRRHAVHSVTAPSSPPIQKHTFLPKFLPEPVTTSTRRVSEGPRRTEAVRIAPTRCLSPSTSRYTNRPDHSRAGRTLPDGDTSISIKRASVREISVENSGLQMVSVDQRVRPLGSSRCDLRRSEKSEEEEEEDELRMLATLKREQEEEQNSDRGGPGLTASQVHHCNISLSASSDDTSTWTQCIPLPVEQGQHYQKEMTPLLHSNPREWMDVISPPIVHPNQQMAGGKGDHSKVSTRGSKLHNNNGEEEFLNLIVLEELAIALPSSGHSESRQSRSSEKPSTDQQAVRLHPGVIASVVFVVVAAVVAAVFIVRRYCCTQSDATYRYSELRHQEEQNAATAAEEDSDSDEDLLE